MYEKRLTKIYFSEWRKKSAKTPIVNSFFVLAKNSANVLFTKRKSEKIVKKAKKSEKKWKLVHLYYVRRSILLYNSSHRLATDPLFKKMKTK